PWAAAPVIFCTSAACLATRDSAWTRRRIHFGAAQRNSSAFAGRSRESIRKRRCPISGKNSISSLVIASVFTGSIGNNGRNGLRPIGNFSSTIFERGSSNHADACSLKLIHGRTVLHFLRQSCGPSLNRKVRGFFAAKPCSQ